MKETFENNNKQLALAYTHTLSPSVLLLCGCAYFSNSANGIDGNGDDDDVYVVLALNISTSLCKRIWIANSIGQ